MLVKLTSSTFGELVMLAEHLRPLFEIIGKECTARGVFTLEQLPDAMQRLRQAVHDEKVALQAAAREARREGIDEEEAHGEGDTEHNEEEIKSGRVGIHLGQRAYPLIHMMDLTHKEKGFIVWECRQDF